MIGNEELPSLVIYDTKLYNTLFYHVLKYCLPWGPKSKNNKNI